MEENRKTGNSSRFLCTGPRNVWNVNAGAADLTGCSGEFLDRRRRLLLAKQTHLLSFFFFIHKLMHIETESGGSGRQEDGVSMISTSFLFPVPSASSSPPFSYFL